MIYTTHLLYCDGPLCVNRASHPLNQDNDIARDDKELLVWAKRNGWKRIMGRDYCADCVAALARKDSDND